MNPLVRIKINEIRRAALGAALQNADPVDFAQGVLEEVPPKYYDSLETMAKDANWFNQLYSDLPEAAAQKEWLTKMRDALLAELQKTLPAE